MSFCLRVTLAVALLSVSSCSLLTPSPETRAIRSVTGLGGGAWREVSVERGPAVSPTYWPAGEGVGIYMSNKDAATTKAGYQMAVWLMRRPGYDPPGPGMVAVQGEGQTAPARFIGESESHRVYLWGGWDGAEQEVVEALGLTPADLSGGAMTDNGLQIVLSHNKWRFRAGEAIPVAIEFRYLDSSSDILEPLEHRGAEITLSRSHSSGVHRKRLPLNRLRRALSQRSGQRAELFRVNLAEHLDFRKLGRYEVRASQTVREGAGAPWEGEVRSNPLTIVIAPAR